MPLNFELMTGLKTYREAQRYSYLTMIKIYNTQFIVARVMTSVMYIILMRRINSLSFSIIGSVKVYKFGLMIWYFGYKI